jgi:hypothetical protein
MEGGGGGGGGVALQHWTIQYKCKQCAMQLSCPTSKQFAASVHHPNIREHVLVCTQWWQ